MKRKHGFTNVRNFACCIKRQVKIGKSLLPWSMLMNFMRSPACTCKHVAGLLRVRSGGVEKTRVSGLSGLGLNVHLLDIRICKLLLMATERKRL